MTRRLWVGVPALAALTMQRMFGQSTQVVSRANASPQRLSRKVLIQYSRVRALYKIPKSASKEAKQLAGMTALLSLTPDQQEQAKAIFDGAVGARGSLRSQLKVAHQNLNQAVRDNDSGAIQREATLIANLHMQKVWTGATANAAFLQILTADQRALLAPAQS